ncbi:MAG: hypothetical protein U0269_23270 [Polyangiales bacterium]
MTAPDDRSAAPSTAPRRALFAALAALGWIALAATSQPRWHVRANAGGPAFTLVGAAPGAPAPSQRFRLVIRPSPSLRAAHANRANASVTLSARGIIAGTPRPAALRLELSAPGGPAAESASNATVFLSRAFACAQSAPECTPPFVATVRWPDAPAGASASVLWSVDAEVSGLGSDAPAGAQIAVDIQPEPQ